MKRLRTLGWIFVPFITIFFTWKRMRRFGKIGGVIWAVFALLIIASYQIGGNVSPDSTTLSAPKTIPQPKASPQISNAPSASTTANSTPKHETKTVEKPATKPVVHFVPKPVVQPATAKPTTQENDRNYLKAVDAITYNTFLEATNIGDQLNQLSTSQISPNEFADFMDTDATLWALYIQKIEPTSPRDSFLTNTRQNILHDLQQLKLHAENMRNDAQSSKLDTVLSEGKSMIAVFNTLKLHYGEAASQMDKLGIKH